MSLDLQASPQAAVPHTPLHLGTPLAPNTPAAAIPTTPAPATEVNQIAQIGSILQKILVELERVKREQASLRDVVSNIQTMHISAPQGL